MRFRTVVASLESLEQPVELRAALRLVEPGGTLHVLSAQPRGIEPRRALDALRGRVELIVPRDADVDAIGLHARVGGRVEETARLAVESEADLIVVSALGEESEAILSHVLEWAACSVLILQPSRERAEVEALAPMFPVCPDCAGARERDPDEWFCSPHREPAKHAFERVLGRR